MSSTRRRPFNQTEHDAQVSVFNWVAWKIKELPDLELLFAVPNGGLRHKGVAKKLKAEGVKSGVPDMLLPVGRGGYFGLAIELKRSDGKYSDLQLTQKKWIAKLTKQNWKIEVCFGKDHAIKVLEDYLKLNSTKTFS